MDILVILFLFISIAKVIKKGTSVNDGKNKSQTKKSIDWKSIANQTIFSDFAGTTNHVETPYQSPAETEKSAAQQLRPDEIFRNQSGLSSSTEGMSNEGFGYGSLGYGSMGGSIEQGNLGSLMEYKPLEHRMDFISSHFEVEGMQPIEGNDFCDPSLGHGRKTVAAAPNAYDIPQNQVPLLSLTPDSILQGVVMSEILAKPSTRKWRKY